MSMLKARKRSRNSARKDSRELQTSAYQTLEHETQERNRFLRSSDTEAGKPKYRFNQTWLKLSLRHLLFLKCAWEATLKKNACKAKPNIFYHVGNGEVTSEAKLVHSNKGNGKGYLEDKQGDLKQWQLSHFIFYSEHLHPWYLQHAICLHKKFYYVSILWAHLCVYNHIFIAPKGNSLK